MLRYFKPLFLRNTMLPGGGFSSGISGTQATGQTSTTYADVLENGVPAQSGQRDLYYQIVNEYGYHSARQVIDAVNKGEIDPYTAQVILSSGVPNFTMSEEQEKTFNNLLARYQSQNALNWQAQQLQNLGLSAAGVLQTGGAHTAQDFSNVAGNKTSRNMQIANQMISMAGRMASSGIHGVALGAVKGAAAQGAKLVAHAARARM